MIVPAYNVAPYLAQCLKSIVEQDYRALEVVVVDDGSTDGSAGMADEWARHDERITVIHQPNGGQSSARNAALQAISGQWVMMVDSDDILAPGAIAGLLSVQQATGADMVVGAHERFNDNNVPQLQPFVAGRMRSYTAHEAVSTILYQRHGLDHSPWARICRRELFEHVRYPQGLIYEDLAVIPTLLQNATRVVHVQGVCYYYRLHAASAMGSFSAKRADVLTVLETLELQWPQYHKALRSRRMSAALNMLRLIPQGDSQWTALQQRSWDMVCQLRWETLFNPRTRWRNKLAAAISLLGLDALLWAINGR